MKTDKRTKKRFSLVLIVALASVMTAGVYVFAGDLDSPGEPAAAVGRMYTIEDTYDLVTESTFSSLGSGFTEPTKAPEIVTGTVDSATATTIFDYPLRDYATGYFIGFSIRITGGTGSGQVRYISDFTTTVDGGTVTVSTDWDTTPSTDSTYRLSGAGHTLTELYQAVLDSPADVCPQYMVSLPTLVTAELVCVTYPGVPGSNTALMWAKKKAGGGCYSEGTLQWADSGSGRTNPTWSDSTKTYTYPGGTTIDNYPAFEWAEELVLCDDGTWSDDSTGCGSASALYSDWRLPSKEELQDLYSKRLLLIPGEYVSTYHWSSKEYGGAATAWYVNFSNGYVHVTTKTVSQNVRVVRDAE